MTDEIKVSELPVATTIDETDYLVGNVGSPSPATSQISIDALRTQLNSTSQTITGDFEATGAIKADTLEGNGALITGLSGLGGASSTGSLTQACNTDNSTPGAKIVGTKYTTNLYEFDENGLKMLDRPLLDTDNKVTNIAAMIALPAEFRVTGVAVMPLGFYDSGDGGGGNVFVFNETASKTTHNGGTIIDPDIGVSPGAAGWWTAPGSGTGVWEMVYSGELIDIRWFGGKNTSTAVTNTSALLAANSVGLPISFGWEDLSLNQCDFGANDVYIEDGVMTIEAGVTPFFLKTISGNFTLKNIRIVCGAVVVPALIHFGDLATAGVVKESFTLDNVDISGNITGYGSYLYHLPSRLLVTKCKFDTGADRVAETNAVINVLIGAGTLRDDCEHWEISENYCRGYDHLFQVGASGYIGNLFVTNNNMYRCGGGNQLYHVFNYTYSGNVHRYCNDFIYLWRSWKVQNNMWDRCGDNTVGSVHIEAISGIFTGNSIQYSNGHGLYLDGGVLSTSYVSNNFIDNSAISGVYVTTTEDGFGGDIYGLTINNNFIHDTQQHGIHCDRYESKLMHIENNTIRGVARSNPSLYAGICFDFTDPYTGTTYGQPGLVNIKGNHIQGNDGTSGVSDSKIEWGILSKDTNASLGGTFYVSGNYLSAPIPFQNYKSPSTLVFKDNITSNLSDLVTASSIVRFNDNYDITTGLMNGGIGIFPDGDITPSVVKNTVVYETANTTPTLIYRFNGGYYGQEITVIVRDSNTTFDFTSSNLYGNGGVDFAAPINSIVKCVKGPSGNDWHCIVSSS